MIAQPTLSCHNTSNRVFWEWYASFMVLIYPVGVPLLFFVILFLHRVKIKRVMLAKKCLVSRIEKIQALEYDIPKMFPDPKEQRRVKVHTEALLKVLEHVDEAVKGSWRSPQTSANSWRPQPMRLMTRARNSWRPQPMRLMTRARLRATRHPQMATCAPLTISCPSKSNIASAH